MFPTALMLYSARPLSSTLRTLPACWRFASAGSAASPGQADTRPAALPADPSRNLFSYSALPIQAINARLA